MNVIITEYPIITVSKKELEIAGFDVTTVTDKQMEQLSQLMQDYYADKDFYKDLKRAATQLGIPKKKQL